MASLTRAGLQRGLGPRRFPGQDKGSWWAQLWGGQLGSLWRETEAPASPLGWWLWQAGLHSSLSRLSTSSARLGQWESALTEPPPLSHPPRHLPSFVNYTSLTVSISSATVGSRHHPASRACDSLSLIRPHIAHLSLGPTHPPESSPRGFPAGASGQEWGFRIGHSLVTEQQNGYSKQGPFHRTLKYVRLKLSQHCQLAILQYKIKSF